MKKDRELSLFQTIEDRIVFATIVIPANFLLPARATFICLASKYTLLSE